MEGCVSAVPCRKRCRDGTAGAVGSENMGIRRQTSRKGSEKASHPLQQDVTNIQQQSGEEGGFHRFSGNLHVCRSSASILWRKKGSQGWRREATEAEWQDRLCAHLVQLAPPWRRRHMPSSDGCSTANLFAQQERRQQGRARANAIAIASAPAGFPHGAQSQRFPQEAVPGCLGRPSPC